MDKSDLGDRMKGYENVQRLYLTKRMPTIIRLDGKAFHTFTNGFERPCDMVFLKTMWETAKYLCENIMGCKIAYTQSDEITLLLTDYDTLVTQAWFDKNIVKMISVSASMATMAFNNAFAKYYNEEDKRILSLWDKAHGFDIGEKFDLSEDDSEKLGKLNRLNNIRKNKIGTAMFDSRVFNIPKEEVANCFVWRQQDATRNAIEAAGQANFSHKQLHKKNCNEIQEMLWQEKGINFNDYPAYQKRGACIVKESYQIQTQPHEEPTYRSRWIVDENIPVFTQDRDYIEKYI